VAAIAIRSNIVHMLTEPKNKGKTISQISGEYLAVNLLNGEYNISWEDIKFPKP
jgi:hypothetical protein